MIGISFFRVLKSALRNFRRNVWLSIATTIIMAITLIMMSLLYFANVLGVHVLQSIQEKVDVSVTFKDDVSDDQIAAISKDISAREDVKDVRVVSSAQALDIFRDRHKDDPFIEQSLKELEKNPLPANMYIVATDPRFYENIVQQLQADKYATFLDKVNFENSRPVIDKLISVMDHIKNIGLISTVVFAVLVILIMFNTIRLAIYSFREEIDIMRLVGASNWFIQGPFVIEAMIVAFLGVVVSNTAIFFVLKSIGPKVQDFFFTTSNAQPFDLYQYALSHLLLLVGMQLLLAVGLAAFSSLFAIRRYLRK
jgi:cell division transport system permease protein